jgi:phosphopantetheine--protein transferase-like protein
MSIVGVGIDLEPVESFRARPWSKRKKFYERIFSKSEIKYCRSFRDSAQRFAARFCAKEALVKAAVSVTSLLTTDVEVARRPNGAPYLKARSKRPAVRKFFLQYETHLSMTHSKQQAAAIVLLVQRGRRT